VQLDEQIDRYSSLPEEERQLIDGLFLKPRRCEPEEVAPSVAPEPSVAPAPAPAANSEERQPVQAPPARECVESGPPRARRPKQAMHVADAGPPASRDALERLAKKGFANGAGGAEESTAEQRITGRVIRVLDGYGFIQSDVSDLTPFFHYTEVAKRGFDHIQPGTPVSFVQVAGDRGPVAKSVRLVEEEEETA
jgi:cold shock CspA family protein